MKTITEFSGFDLRRGFALRAEIIKTTKLEPKEKESQADEASQAKTDTPQAESSSEEIKEVKVEEGAPEQTEKKEEQVVEAQAESPKTEEEKTVDAKEETEEKKESLEVKEENTQETAETKAEENKEETKKADSKKGENKKFKKGPQKKQRPPKKSREQIIAEKKEMEEKIRPALEAKITEEFKYEGEKLSFFVNALSVIFGKRAADLRRVVVFTTEDEKEKVSEHARKIGDHFFLAEYMAPLVDPRKKKGRGKFKGKGRGKGRGKGKGKGRFDKKKGGANFKSKKPKSAKPSAATTS